MHCNVIYAIIALRCHEGRVEEAMDLLQTVTIVSHAKLGMDNEMSQVLQEIYPAAI